MAVETLLVILIGILSLMIYTVIVGKCIYSMGVEDGIRLGEIIILGIIEKREV